MALVSGTGSDSRAESELGGGRMGGCLSIARLAAASDVAIKLHVCRRSLEMAAGRAAFFLLHEARQSLGADHPNTSHPSICRRSRYTW